MYGDWRLIRSWSSPSVIVTSSILASGALSSSALCGAVGPPAGAAVRSRLASRPRSGSERGSLRFWHPAKASPTRRPPATKKVARSRIVTTGSGSTREGVQQGPPGSRRSAGRRRRDREAAIRELAPAGGDQRAAGLARLGQRERDPGGADLERDGC